MVNTIKTAFQISATSSMNSFIYVLKKTPILKKIIPQKAYSSEKFKKVIMVFAFLFEILEAFIGKFLYIGIGSYWLALTIGKENYIPTFFHIFFCLTLIGAIIQSNILKANSQKYYGVIMMHMNAKQYAIADECFYLLKTFISFLASLIFFIWAMGLNIYYAFVLAIFLVVTKLIGEAISIAYYTKKKKVLSQKFGFNVIIIVLGLLATYGLPYLQITIPASIIINITPVLLLVAIFAINYLMKSEIYAIAYKKVVTYQKVFFNTEQMMEQTKKSQYAIDKKDILVEEKETSKRTGYDYFNYLFFSRHRKFLLKSSRNIALVYLGVVILLGIGATFNKDMAGQINNMIMTWLPYFVFIMYMSNRGSTVTQAMFVNCDNSMLTYKFYRKNKVILQVFGQRLKTIIGINLIPAIVLAVGLPILLAMSGGTANGMVYLSLFISILFMSIFFSVHYLTIYYLLQPYDIHMNFKSVTYGIISFVTYLACFACMKIKVDTFIFSLGTIGATIIYSTLALILVYHFAPKTFRLK